MQPPASVTSQAHVPCSGGGSAPLLSCCPLRAVGGVAESMGVSAVRRRFACPQASSSLSVLGCRPYAPAGVHKAWAPRVVSSCLGCRGVAAAGSHGTVSWRSSTSMRRMGSPHIAVIQLCSSCRASGGFGPQQVSGEAVGGLSALAKGVVSGESRGAWVGRLLCGPSLLLLAAAVRSSAWSLDVTGWCRTAVVVRCCLKGVAPCPQDQV